RARGAPGPSGVPREAVAARPDGSPDPLAVRALRGSLGPADPPGRHHVPGNRPRAREGPHEAPPPRARAPAVGPVRADARAHGSPDLRGGAPGPSPRLDRPPPALPRRARGRGAWEDQDLH